MANQRFTNFAWVVLGFTLLVVLWGAVVRATGSGDGCGAHWPTCDGVLIPKGTRTGQFIEFFHRITSGLSLLGVLGLLVWSWRLFPKGHLVRLGTGLSLLFMVTESLLGASLVLFRLVAHDTSVARAVVAPIHLTNTLLLIGSIALTAWWSAHPEHRPVWRGQGVVSWLLGLGFAGILLTTAAGAITALGDTLFPVSNTPEAVQRALAPGEHFLVQLRIMHPFIAIAVSVFTIMASGAVGNLCPNQYSAFFVRAVGVVFIAQLLLGFINVRLGAPLQIQVLHLLLSDLVWLSWLLLSVTALSSPRANPSNALSGVTRVDQ